MMCGQDEQYVPLLGFGTWKSEPHVVGNVVKYALKLGYRHLDCAFVYKNESEVGKAIIDSEIGRKSIFVTSKLWNTEHRPNRVKQACENSLRELKLDYLDLYLMHWPVAFLPDKGTHPKNANGQFELDDVPLSDTWEAMQNLVTSGLVRNIGVSNFGPTQLAAISNVGKFKPAMDQVECHPYLNQEPLIKHCKRNAIAMTAYSPLGNPSVKSDDSVLENNLVKELAASYGRTPAQIVLRWLVQRGLVVIPKSVTPSRIKENSEIFEFLLSPEDLLRMNGLNRGAHVIHPSWAKFAENGDCNVVPAK